ELLEPAGRLLGLVGERALLAAAAALAAGRRCAPLPLRLGLLAPRQLLQLFGELVDLAVPGLIAGALLHLVLVGQLVELELEQIGEIFRHLIAVAAFAAAVAHADFELVLLLGFEKELQRPLFG